MSMMLNLRGATQLLSTWGRQVQPRMIKIGWHTADFGNFKHMKCP